MLSSNLTDSPETRQRVAAQVLRTIVDEKLQMQEAKRQNVTATDEEVNKALAQIEKQNNMQTGQLDQVLKSHGIERSEAYLTSPLYRVAEHGETVRCRIDPGANQYDPVAKIRFLYVDETPLVPMISCDQVDTLIFGKLATW